MKSLVKEFMTDDVVTASEATSIEKLQQIMKDFIINHIPIVNDKNELTGIVSRIDIIHAYLKNVLQTKEEKLPNMLAKDLMVKPITIKDNAEISQACEIISNNSFHSLPVINSNNNIVGIISTTDLLENINKFKSQ